MPFSSCSGADTSCQAAPSIGIPFLPPLGFWLPISGHRLSPTSWNHPSSLPLATCKYHPHSLGFWHIWCNMDTLLTVVDFRQLARHYHSESLSPLPIWMPALFWPPNGFRTKLLKKGRRGRKERKIIGIEEESQY